MGRSARLLAEHGPCRFRVRKLIDARIAADDKPWSGVEAVAERCPFVGGIVHDRKNLIGINGLDRGKLCHIGRIIVEAGVRRPRHSVDQRDGIVGFFLGWNGHERTRGQSVVEHPRGSASLVDLRRELPNHGIGFEKHAFTGECSGNDVRRRGNIDGLHRFRSVVLKTNIPDLLDRCRATGDRLLLRSALLCDLLRCGLPYCPTLRRLPLLRPLPPDSSSCATLPNLALLRTLGALALRWLAEQRIEQALCLRDRNRCGDRWYRDQQG